MGETLPQHGISLDPGDAGALRGPFGARGVFGWSESQRAFTATVTRPSLFSCAKAEQELRDFGEACARVNIVTRSAAGPDVDIWRVDSPDVRAKDTLFPEIVFESGDHVRVEAGGCAQTGGHGNTWRLYVGSKGDRLHYASIRLPGQAGFQPLRDIRPDKVFTIPPGSSGDKSLRLAYEDNDYSNNGYWGRDPGPEGQCLNQPNAWVRISVTRSSTEGGIR